MSRVCGGLLIVAMAAMFNAGCVSQREADQQRDLYRKAREQVRDLQSQLEQEKSRLASLKQSKGRGVELASKLNDARAEIRKLRNALDQAKSSLAQTQAGPGELSPELVSKLRSLADNNPQLMSFNADRKMVRLKSDLTFALGSTDVKSRAKRSLARLASVLQGGEASQFEVRVVGHTDNVPVTNPANKRKYEDNWGLSAFRAKAVMEVLAANGVPQSRMSIAGYGSQQPVVPNTPKSGAEQNRRVEIFLVPPYNPRTQKGKSSGNPPSRGQSNSPGQSAPSSGQSGSSSNTGQSMQSESGPSGQSGQSNSNSNSKQSGPSSNTGSNESGQSKSNAGSSNPRPTHFK